MYSVDKLYNKCVGEIDRKKVKRRNNCIKKLV